MFSIVIFSLKVLSVSNRGSQIIISPLAIKLKGFFIFYEIILLKKGFLKFIIVYNINIQNKCTLN